MTEAYPHPAAYRHQRRVEFRDTDAAGIVHFSVFFNYMEEAEHAMLRDLGLNVVMTDAEGTFSFPRVSVQCDYRAPLKFSDVVTIDVSVRKIGQSSIRYRCDFTLNGQEIATGSVTAVCCRLSTSDHPETMAIPEFVREKLQRYTCHNS